MITDHLQYLIMHHDCVVLPGIGAFLARYESARIEPDGTIMLPPRRLTGFNAELSHDDGLLAGSIARATGCGYDAAAAEVSREVEAMLRRMDAGMPVTFPRIGTLARLESGALEFVPAPPSVSAANAMYAAFPSVALSEAAVRESAAKVLEVDLASRAVRRREPFVVRALKYTAAAAVVIGVALTASTPILVNRHADFASISAPKITVEKPRYIPMADEGRELYIVRPDSASSMATVPAAVAEDGAGYYLIVASFGNERDAARFIAERGDSQLKIVKGERRCRVYAHSGASFVEAAAPASDAAFSSRYPDAWVYKKR